MLWTEKYKPKTSKDIVGQGKGVKQALDFLDNWSPGKALLLAGNPGSGKTSIVEAVANERGMELLQLNASDKRNPAEIQIFAHSTKTMSLFGRGKAILIDEVDGLSGNSDRGGVQAITELIKSSRHPVFMTANDLYSEKLRSLRKHCDVAKLSKIPYPSIEKKLREICKQEGIDAEGEALKTLARFVNGDLRAAITDLQTVADGKIKFSDNDLEALGFRERESSIFDILPTILRSGNFAAARKAIQESDKDPDEIFWWIENNIYKVASHRVAEAYELLSWADLYRGRVRRQQNWRFKAYMVDLMACASAYKDKDSHLWRYQPPERIMRLGRTKGRRATLDSLAEKIGGLAHCSKRTAKLDYLPYLKLILKKNTEVEGLQLEEDENKLLV